MKTFKQFTKEDYAKQIRELESSLVSETDELRRSAITSRLTIARRHLNATSK